MRPPPGLTIRVCDSLTCEMMGAQALLDELPRQVGEAVRVVRAPCMGRCDTAPVAEVGHRHVDKATLESLVEAVRAGDTHAEVPDYKGYDAYQHDDGYTLLRDCLGGKRSLDEVIEIVSDSGLRGFGGGGFSHRAKVEHRKKLPRATADGSERR